MSSSSSKLADLADVITVRSLRFIKRLYKREWVPGELIKDFPKKRHMDRALNFTLWCLAGASSTGLVIHTYLRTNAADNMFIPWKYLKRELVYDSRDTEPCDTDWDKLISDIGARHGFTLDQFREAASRCLPVEPMLEVVERYLRAVVHDTTRITGAGGSQLWDAARSQLHAGELDDVPEYLIEIVNTACRGIDRSAKADELWKNVEAFRAGIYEGLVKEWHNRQYFDTRTYYDDKAFGHRHSDRAFGYNIGSNIVLLFYPAHLDLTWILSNIVPPPPRFNSLEIATALRQWGVAILRQAISPEEVERLQEVFHTDGDNASHIGVQVLAHDGNIKFGRFAHSRLHMLLRGTTMEQPTTACNRSWMGVLHSVAEDMAAQLDDGAGERRRMYLADVRLVAVDHGSPPERHFHADNGAAGFTVLLPLTDRDAKLGTQVLLPGTHILSIGDGSLSSLIERLRTYSRRFMMSGGSLKVHELYPDGCWRAGDALILDSRTLYRGEHSVVFKPGVMLVFRYDFEGHEAPGITNMQRKVLFKFGYLANLIGSYLYRPWLPAPSIEDGIIS
ncbi:hypothetical protein FOZ61_002880 [Perkinsus olseni]|uniref:Uncharacterized protein n=1 Tax=Perkinsus olseni TaxID=32597 RepID=A0A7J6LRH1_PEROL|nr:hypothetical protein FOZ61_002880 [Perkinsus olseni]KAF4667407.1 hypothetical protein FOL46_002546 [Perkinsus olseni]